MISSHRAITESVDSLLGEVAGEFIEKLAAGEDPQIEEYAQQHPEIADLLRDLLPALDVIGDSIGSVSAAATVGQRSDGPTRKQLGDYRILSELGRGGMGVVYEAEQISLGRSVALKVLPFAAVMDQKAITRFRNEARAAATLDHPNIVPVHAVGNERGVYYYAMSLIHGLTLAEIIGRLQRRIAADSAPESSHLSIDEIVTDGKPSRDDHMVEWGAKSQRIAPDVTGRTNEETYRELQAAISTHRSSFDAKYFQAAASLAVQAAEALEHAHQHGIVHRDIKPANLMIDAQSKLWITDFGLARMESDPGITMTGDLVGTLRYMAPEQALAKRVVVDHRADIYALGVTLYELLTLRPTYDGADRQTVLRQIALEEPRPLRHYNRAVPEDLQTIVLKAISKNPDERYSSAQRMADDLRAFLEHKPIKAKPASVLQKSAKWSRRHKTVVVSLAVILVLAMVGLAISNALITKQRNAAQQAQLAERDQRLLAEAAQEEAEQQHQLALERGDELERNLYVAIMRQAQADWEDGQVARMHERLARFLPTPGRPDLRGWEWYYLLGLTQQSSATLREHFGKVWSVSWCPDGRRLASGGDDGVLRLWDTENWRMGRILRHGAYIRRLAWRPDGKMLASVGGGEIKVWNVDSGFPARVFQNAHDLLAWSPDGSKLAGATRDMTFRVWEVATGQELWQARQENVKVGLLRAIAWHPGGRLVAFAMGGGSVGGARVEVWNIDENERQLTIPAEFADPFCLAWSPNGNSLAVGGYFGGLKLFDANSGLETHWLPATASIHSAAFSPDGEQIAASSGQRVQVWELATKQERSRWQGHVDEVLSLSWSPDGARLASGSLDGTVKVWGAAPLRVRQDVLKPELVWSPNDQMLACVDGNGILIRDSTTGDEIQRLPLVVKPEVDRLDWSPNGRYLACRHDGEPGLVIWDLRQGAELTRFERRGNLMRWNPDSRHLAFGSGSKIEIWDIQAMICVRTIPGDGSSLRSLSWDTNGNRLAVGSWSGYITVWDVSSVEPLHVLAGHVPGKWVRAYWNPESSLLASAGWDCSIRLWDGDTGNQVGVLFGHTSSVASLSWTTVGGRLASASNTGQVCLWEPETGREMLVLDGDAGHRLVARFSNSGMRLAMSSSRTLRILDAGLGMHYARTNDYFEDLARAKQTSTPSHGTNPWHAVRSYAVKGALQRRLKLDATDSWKKVVQLTQTFPVQERSPSHWGYLGRSLYYLGHFKEAYQTLETASALHPDEGPTLENGPRWWYLAMTLHELGRTELARSYYDLLVKELEATPSPSEENKELRREAAAAMGIEAKQKGKPGPDPAMPSGA